MRLFHTVSVALLPRSLLFLFLPCMYYVKDPAICVCARSPSFCPYWNPALLGQLEKLSTLILDSNNYTSHIKFPYMPSVTTVCINKNKLNNLPVFVDEIRRKFPNIKWAWEHFCRGSCRRMYPDRLHSVFSLFPLVSYRILSMMNNEAAPSYFNGGSLTQYKDYRWESSSFHH